MSKINNVKIKYFIKSHPIRWPNKSGTQQQTYWKRPTFICRRNGIIFYSTKCKKIREKHLRSALARICRRFGNWIHKPNIIFHREILIFLRCKFTFLLCNFIFLCCGVILARCGVILARCGVQLLRCGFIFLRCVIIFLRCNFILDRCGVQLSHRGFTFLLCNRKNKWESPPQRKMHILFFAQCFPNEKTKRAFPFPLFANA